VETCPSEALTFGNLNDPQSKVSRLSKSRRAFRLLEDLGTEPKVFYLKEGEWYDG
jgi:molybdopterin-containing oxidoreductase family iron-sulfur binding subunit